LHCRLGRFLAFNLIAAVIWCFGLAAAGWALGGAWTEAHHAFGYSDVLVAVAALALMAGAAGRRVRA
jgi:membrane protein DedA with SNARE-associated domain